MMKNTGIWRGIVCLLALAPGINLYSQADGIGARSTSLAGVTAMLEDVWATANNPAGLGGYHHLSFATNLEQRYLLKELGYYSAAISVPAGSGSFGLFSIFSSCLNYVDQKVSLAYGTSFGERFLFGASLVYSFQKAGEESLAIHQLSYQLGTIVELSDKIKFGFSAYNPFQFYYKSQDYATLPSVLRLGMTYAYAPSFLIHLECEKDLNFTPTLKLGMEYCAREVFIIRGGIRILPAVYAFGVSFRHHSMLFEISSIYHQYLGFTPQVSLQYDLR